MEGIEMGAKRHAAQFGLVFALALAAWLPVAAQEAPEPRPGDTLGWHIVRPGETLEAITEQYLGTPVLWPENWRLNPDIRDPDLLRIGQRLRVIVHRKLPKRVAEVKTVSRRVEEKPHPNPWTEAQVGDLLRERDGLRTYHESSARLRFSDGFEMLVTEDSLIFLHQLDEDVLGHTRDGIEIVKGQTDLKLRRGHRRRGEIEVVFGAARAQPQPGPSGVAASRVARSGDGGGKVMVYSGSSLVAAAGDEVQVPEGMGTTVPKGAAPAPPEKLLPAPVLLGPAPGWKAPWANPELSWKPVEGASVYTVEVFEDPGAAKLVVRQQGVHGTTWAPESLPLGSLFWRVTAVAPNGLDGYPSRPRSLDVTEALPDLEPPVVAVLGVAGVRAAGGGLRAVPGGVVRLVAHDDLSGVESVGYRWDGGPWKDAGEGMVRVPEEPGSHELQFRGRDRRGRVSKTWSVSLEVTVEGPLPPRIHRASSGSGRGDEALSTADPASK